MDNEQQSKRSANTDAGCADTGAEDELSERMFTPEISNADNAQSGPAVRGIGHVDVVNGEKAREVPEFVPTVAELETLFEHWFHQEMDLRLFMFMTSSWGSSDARIRDFAARRINRIWGLLGQERGQSLWNCLYEDFWQKENDPRLRSCFEKGKLPPAVAEKWANGEQPDEADWTGDGE